MHVYYHVFGLELASYGSMIALGVIVANLIAVRIAKKEGDDYNNLLILQAYALLGAMTGAKLLYVIVNYKIIRWDLLTDPAYFHSLISEGFVFYGGLIVGLALAFLSGKFHRFDSVSLIRKYVFLIPLAHAFGRVGCFLAGCCYGIPYDGPFSVVFPANSHAPGGIPLFPVQLLEMLCLILLSLFLLFLSLHERFPYTAELYLILYGVLRFFLEYLRGDSERGRFLSLSTSQWISIFLFVLAAVFLFVRKARENK